MILSQQTVLPPSLRKDSWTQYINPFSAAKGMGCVGLGCPGCGCGQSKTGMGSIADMFSSPVGLIAAAAAAWWFMKGKRR